MLFRSVHREIYMVPNHQFGIDVGMFQKSGMFSFLKFIEFQDQIPLKELIKNKGKDTMIQYFNYNLTADVWNLLVNKQIYMKFERLLIEKQLHKKRTQERDL